MRNRLSSLWRIFAHKTIIPHQTPYSTGPDVEKPTNNRKMRQEIERKFLVEGDFKREAINNIRIIQGYLSSTPERSVRIRIAGEKGFLTVKGAGNANGTSRLEWETEIPVADARELIVICEPGVIDKTRFIIPAGNGMEWEVDEFHGDNEGLIIAEIELPAEDEKFDEPAWLGKEVTGDPRYYNSMLSRNPYKTWH